MNCHNSDRFLKEAINSVYSQTYKNWEIIFWDNNSTDLSARIAKSYDKKIRYYKTKQTDTLGKARKLAISQTSGKYLSFLDCDDMFLPEKLRVQVSLMEGTNYCLCYGSAIIINSNGKFMRKYKVPSRKGMLFKNLLEKYEINFQTVLLRKSVLDEKYCFFDDTLEYSPDFNLFMKISSIYPLICTSQLLSKYRIHPNSYSSNISKSIQKSYTEGRYTLNYIFQKKPELLQKYKCESSVAFDKMCYYEVIYLLKAKCKKDAISLMSNIKSCKALTSMDVL